MRHENGPTPPVEPTAGGDTDVQTSRRPALLRMSVFDDRSRYVDRFGWLLILTVLTVTLTSLVDPAALRADAATELAELLAGYVALVTLLLAFAASGLSQRYLVILMVLVAVLALGQTIVAVLRIDIDGQAAAPPVGPLLFSLAAFTVVVRRLARHRRVTRATLLGAVTAYLFIPLTYYYAFRVVNAANPGSMFGQPEASPTFMYFSLTTVTTLGYGEPRPVSNLARLLATSEALVGQLYLVTVVALIVGLMSAGWQERLRSRRDGESAEPPTWLP